MFRKALVTALLALSLTFPALAQESTPIVTDAPTVEPTAIVVTEVPPVEPAPVTPAENAISVSTLVFGIVVAVLGGGTVGVILNRFGSNKANLDAAEKLFLGASPETQEIIRERFEQLEGIVSRLMDIVDKVTDGKPNEATPPAS